MSSIAASAFGEGFNHEGIDANGNAINATKVWRGAGKFASSGAGMIAFGTVSGGAGAALTGGNFWQGAATGLVVSGLNHYVHQIEIKSQIESKYPGLYKTLSKLKSYVKDHPSILESLRMYSGFSDSKIFQLLSIKNLVNMVKVGGTDGHFGLFDPKDPNYVRIRANIVTSLDSGGYKFLPFKISETLNGTSFFAAVTILHEIVHYGRYWNGLSRLIDGSEAGQTFEKRVFGGVLDIVGSTKNANTYDWKF
ncbi:hypothetical protein [Flavobacterium ajazii]|uniref:hypothetical protein n=1 Tax=Flavobacterium ajazii TaxID=2692318 RepID=UPI0013D69E5A|nr:hypothetical protein [Flavobacterium ajazii]